MKDIEDIKFNEDKSERVDRFLRKEMDEKESKAFKEDVQVDSELREYYNRQFNLMRGVNFYHVTEMMKEKESELSRSITPKKSIIYTIATTVAAAMLCGFIVWDRSVAINVGEQMYYSQVLRGDDDVRQLVEDGKYQEAVDLINKELDLSICFISDEQYDQYTQHINNIKYQKALILLMDGKKRKAKDILKELNDDRSNEILNKLIW